MMFFVNFLSIRLLRTKQPPPIQLHDNAYLQILCRHTRAIFLERPAPSLAHFERHVACARSVLDLIWSLIRNFHVRLSESSWSVLVDAVTVAATALLPGSTGSHYNAMKFRLNFSPRSFWA